jgi:hypothetical protein
MKYIKRFNEEVSYTYGNDINFLKDLEDDIEGIFVQVLDDGWVLDYQLTDYAGNIGWVKLRKESGGESKTIEDLLPYLHHFYDYIKSKGYDFHNINLFDWICVDYDRSKAAINFGRKDWDFIEQHLIAVSDRRGRTVGSISINLSHNFTSKDRTRNLNSYNESNSEGLTEEQVQDFCEMNLAYLMDDGLKILVSPDYFDLKIIDYKVTLSFRLFANKRWSQIKDHVIQFLTHLRNEYELLAEERGLYQTFVSNIRIDMIGSVTTYPEWFNIDDVILEKIDDEHKVSTIQFKIKGKK